jgi:hypothetical protein
LENAAHFFFQKVTDWPEKVTHYVFRFPNGEVSHYKVPCQMPHDFLRHFLSRNLRVPFNQINVLPSPSEPVSEVEFWDVSGPTLSISFKFVGTRDRFDLSHVSLFDRIFDLKKKFSEAHGFEFRLSFSLDGRTLEDNSRLSSCGFHNGVCVSVSLLPARIVRSYFRKDEIEYVFDSPADDATFESLFPSEVPLTFELNARFLDAKSPVSFVTARRSTPILVYERKQMTVVDQRGGWTETIEIGRRWDEYILLRHLQKRREILSASTIVQDGEIITGAVWELASLDRPFFVSSPDSAKFLVKFGPSRFAARRVVVLPWPFDAGAFAREIEREIGVRNLSIERAGAVVTVSYQLPEAVAAYAVGEHIMTVQRGETVRDVARRVLGDRGESNCLPGVLALSFWGCQLHPELPFCCYQLPEGAGIGVAEVERKTITIQGHDIFWGATDNIKELRNFLKSDQIFEGVDGGQLLCTLDRVSD